MRRLLGRRLRRGRTAGPSEPAEADRTRVGLGHDSCRGRSRTRPSSTDRTHGGRGLFSSPVPLRSSLRPPPRLLPYSSPGPSTTSHPSDESPSALDSDPPRPTPEAHSTPHRPPQCPAGGPLERDPDTLLMVPVPTSNFVVVRKCQTSGLRWTLNGPWLVVVVPHGP